MSNWRRFGETRIRGMWKESSLEAMGRVLGVVRRFVEDEIQADDICHGDIRSRLGL